MKQIFSVLLACLLLCGCAREIPETTAGTEETTIPPTTSPVGFYDAGSSLEEAWQGAVRTYPLDREDAKDLITFGDGLLVFSGEETTTLTLLKGDSLYPAASMELDFVLSTKDPSFAICGSALSYFDPLRKETVVLDSQLKPVSHIPSPDGMTGSPVLSSDRSMLYYCTRTSLCAWDLESGIRRTIKEMSYPAQTVCGLPWGGNIIHCQTKDGNLFLCADTGRLVNEWDGDIRLTSTGNFFSAAFRLGMNPVLVYGDEEAARMLLSDSFSGEYCLFPGHPAALWITTPSEAELRLEFCDLTGGNIGSVLTLETEQTPAAAAYAGGYVYLLTFDAGYGCSTIYRWDPAMLATNSASVSSECYATAADPQAAAFTQCERYAAELSSQYGIEILIGDAAAATEPWDYDLEPETQPALLLRELTLLDQRLQNYPEGMLADTASNFTSLKLCLVRSVTGSAESGSLSTATGVQFLNGSDAYVAITVGKYANQALYHELFHVMETHIFNNSIAFDQWDSLNPAGFTYTYGHAANENRDSGIYLHSESRAFIDTYSMSFPKEDRARVMEYGMLPGNAALFESPVLQAKLQTLCTGIREAYGLEDAEESFLWEQYLN